MRKKSRFSGWEGEARHEGKMGAEGGATGMETSEEKENQMTPLR